jgi:Mce-associated membrane protein
MIVRVLAVLAVLSLAAAGVTGWFWWDAAHSPAAELAAERDSVLADGLRHAVELNTMDYRNPDFDRWRNAATGPLLDRLTRNLESDRQSVATNKTVSSARIVTAAVTSLNSHTGSANMIAAVEISLAQGDAAPAAKVSRLDLDLSRTDAGWKVSALEVVGT